MTLSSRLCWAFFAGTKEQVEADSALRAEMQETLRELCNKLENRFPDWKIPEGRNTNVQSVRLMLDPIKCEHRPLIFYIVPTPLSLCKLTETGGLSTSRHCIDPISSSQLLVF